MGYKHITTEDKIKITQLYTPGARIEPIAKDVGHSTSAVRAYLKEKGIFQTSRKKPEARHTPKSLIEKCDEAMSRNYNNVLEAALKAPPYKGLDDRKAEVLAAREILRRANNAEDTNVMRELLSAALAILERD